MPHIPKPQMPNVLHGSDDSDEGRGRKRHEADFKFNWTPVILVGLISTTMWGPFNKSLEKCQKRHDEEDRIEEQKKQEREERERRTDRRRDRARSMHDFEEPRYDSDRRRERVGGRASAWAEDQYYRGRGRGQSVYEGRPRSVVEPGRSERSRPRHAIDERYGSAYEYEVIERPRQEYRDTRPRRRDRSW